MWDEDWQRLGLAPTDDAAALKKAYAQRLRHTRPDDDAQAYQALRESYERLQQWQRWQRQMGGFSLGEAATPAEQPTEPPAEPPAEPRADAVLDAVPETPAGSGRADASIADPAAAAAPEPAPESASDASPGSAPESAPEFSPEPEPDLPALIDRVELAWRRDGEAAARATWVEVRAMLDRQPLGWHDLSSAAFARWVLNLPQLPPDLVADIEAHFGWLGDFRSAQSLGPQLAQALYEQLPERLPPPPPSEALREAGAPLLRLQRLQQTAPAWRVLPLAMAAGPALSRLMQDLGLQSLRRLGLEVPQLQALTRLLSQAFWLRLALLLLPAAALMALWRGLDAAQVLVWLLTWATVGAVLMGLGLVLGAVLREGRDPRQRSSALQSVALHIARWRAAPSSRPLGLVLLALPVLWGAWTAGPPVASGALHSPASVALDWLAPLAQGLSLLAGVVLLWSVDARRAWMVGALSLWCGGLFVRAWSDALGGLGAAALGQVWLLLALLGFEGRLHLAGIAEWPLRPVLNSLGLAERWGYVLGLTPVLLALGLGLLPGMPLRTLDIFLLWVLANLGLGLLQNRADAWAMARLEQADQAPG